MVRVPGNGRKWLPEELNWKQLLRIFERCANAKEEAWMTIQRDGQKGRLEDGNFKFSEIWMVKWTI